MTTRTFLSIIAYKRLLSGWGNKEKARKNENTGWVGGGRGMTLKSQRRHNQEMPSQKDTKDINCYNLVSIVLLIRVLARQVNSEKPISD